MLSRIKNNGSLYGLNTLFRIPKPIFGLKVTCGGPDTIVRILYLQLPVVFFKADRDQARLAVFAHIDHQFLQYLEQYLLGLWGHVIPIHILEPLEQQIGGSLGPEAEHFHKNILKIDPGVHLVQRSEEHTSELQSRENLVCRLLLEKKNN